MQRRESAPRIESLRDGLSCSRSPFLNQWMVLTTMSPAFFVYPRWGVGREFPKTTTTTTKDASLCCFGSKILSVPSHVRNDSFSPGQRARRVALWVCRSSTLLHEFIHRAEPPDQRRLHVWTAGNLRGDAGKSDTPLSTGSND